MFGQQSISANSKDTKKLYGGSLTLYETFPSTRKCLLFEITSVFLYLPFSISVSYCLTQNLSSLLKTVGTMHCKPFPKFLISLLTVKSMSNCFDKQTKGNKLMGSV